MADEIKPRRKRRVTVSVLFDAGLKRCTTCKEIKPTAEFTKVKTRWDGLDPKCRDCERKLRSTPEAREKTRLRSASRRAANPEKFNADSRRRYRVEKAAGRKRIRIPTEKKREKQREWRIANRDKANAASREAKRKARAISRDADRLYRERRKEEIKARNARYRLENYDKIKANRAAYARANKGKVNAQTAKRTAARLRAIPSWADIKMIEEFYLTAIRLTQETGVPHEVDHIIPLQGQMVCGLHCERNLQVITRNENRRKTNALMVDS